MGSFVKIDGAAEWAAERITTVQDATPLDPADTFGGTGTVSFTLPPGPESKSLLGKSVELVDSERGTVDGTVAAITGTRANVAVQAHTSMVALVTSRTAAPHVGTLESLVLYYFGLCGITSGVTVDASIASTPVVVPGWYGNVWAQLKNLCAAYQVEIAPVDGGIVVRPPRSNTIGPRFRESPFSWGLDESRLAQTVEAWYYEAEEITDGLVVGNELAPVSNLGPGAVVEFNVRLSASLSSVAQPVPVDSVGWGDASASEYSVLDQYDEPVSAAEWAAGGGRVEVSINEDTRSVHVTVVGSQDRIRAPYRLTGVALSGAEFSTLRIVGTGVRYKRAKYTMHACVDERAQDVVGAEVDNPFLGSWGHAHLVLLRSAMAHASASKRISGGERMQGLSFGNIAGARVYEDFTFYRVRSATIAAGQVGYTAEPDTTIGDRNAVWAGRTIGDWNATWAGKTLRDVALRPLTKPTSGSPVVEQDPQPYPDLFYPDQIYPA